MFEVFIDDDLVYTNNSECSVLPRTSMILKEIEVKGGILVKPIGDEVSENLSLEGAACPLLGPDGQVGKQPIQHITTVIKDGVGDHNGDKSCGCSCESP